jgi:hypothetical protein
MVWQFIRGRGGCQGSAIYNTLIFQLKLATKSLRGEHLILDTGRDVSCLRCAILWPPQPPWWLHMAAFGMAKEKSKNNTLGNFFNFFSVFYKDLG